MASNMGALTGEQQKLADKLTNLQRLTVIHLVSGMDYPDAHKEAGGKAKTQGAASAVVSRMLRDVNVSAFRDSLIATAANSAIMTREEMLERLTAMARTDMADVVDISNRVIVEGADGENVEQSFWALKNVEDMKEGSSASISELTATKDGLKIKLHDQKAAMKQLADLQGYNAATKTDHTSSDGSMSPKDSDISSEELEKELAKYGIKRQDT